MFSHIGDFAMALFAFWSVLAHLVKVDDGIGGEFTGDWKFEKSAIDSPSGDISADAEPEMVTLCGIH